MEKITFGEAWGYGGFLMWVLALMSVAAFTVVIYLIIIQWRSVFLSGILESL